MERVHVNGAESSSTNRDQASQSQDHSHVHSHERPHEPTAGVSYERLHPAAPDLVLPATFLAVTLLGILFVLIILFIWLRTHLSFSSSKKKYDKSTGTKTKETHLLRTLEPNEMDHRFNLVVSDPNPNERNQEDCEVDDFKFKLPNILDDTADFKYIDELDRGRNMSPPILKMNNNGVSSPKLPETDNTESDSKKNDSSGNSTPSGATKLKANNDKFVFPDDPAKASKSNVESKFGKFKMALPEQPWIVRRKPSLNWRSYSINMPKGLSFVDADASNELSSGEGSSKKYSATRSPSLEKDDKSPFVPLNNESAVEFVFQNDPSEINLLKSVSSTDNINTVVEVKVQPVSTNTHGVIFDTDIISSDANIQKKEFKVAPEKSCPVRKFGASNIGLRICTVNDINLGLNTEKIEMQNSPRLLDSTVGKENNPSPKFNFSPKSFECKSPKFFGSTEQRSPKYVIENQSRNSSPKLLGAEKPPSPKFTYVSEYKSTQSPLILNSSESRFLFDREKGDLIDDNTKVSDNSDNNDNVFTSKEDDYNLVNRFSETNIDSEKTDLEKKLPECHVQESLETLSLDNRLNDNFEFKVNLNEISCLNNNVQQNQILQTTESDNLKIDETDSCDEFLAIPIDAISSHIQSIESLTDETEMDGNPMKNSSSSQENQDNLSVSHTGSGTANYRRQRLKSISLDSDNAKFIQQNLGIPIIKHLKQENLYDPCQNEGYVSSSNETTGYGDQVSPSIMNKNKATYFNFDDDGSEYSGFGSSNDALENTKELATNISHNECSDSYSDTVDSSCIFLRENAPAIAFNEMQPRFSPKEFENLSCDESNNVKANKNKRNLTIDINKRDSELEKELSEYDRLDSGTEKRMTPKTPTLKIKATSLDSSETLNLSLPPNNTLQVPQNSISVPNTPKRQLKRARSQKVGKLVKASHYTSPNYGTNLNDLVPRICSDSQQGRKLYVNLKCNPSFIDSGIFLKENRANLMLYQTTKCPTTRGVNASSSSFSRRMGSFDENMVDYSEVNRQIGPQIENRLSLLQKPCDMLGSNLVNFKQNLSVSSTNLKTLPEGVPSNDFEIHPEGKSSKKSLLQSRGSNQSLAINFDGAASNLKYSTLSLQGSNLSLTSFGASNHNLANIKNSPSNFSLNTDNRQKKNILERRNSNTSLTLNLDYVSQHGNRHHSGSHCNLQGSHYSLTNHEGHPNPGQSKKCLLQRRGSNTSLTLNLQNSNSNLNRCTSNSSLNIHNEVKTGQKKGLLERRSSNTSLTLNINNANCQFDNNRVLSVSNYNLETSGSGLSQYNSTQSINTGGENQKKGLLERRSSNTSLTLNINSSHFNMQSSDVPRDIEIDDSVLQNNLKSYKDNENFLVTQQREKHRKSLSTENLFYKSKLHQSKNTEEICSFGSHDNLCSNSYVMDSLENFETGGQNLTYVYGDQDNELIYVVGAQQHIENAGYQGVGPIRNITTKPLSPHSTSEDFKLYLANIQHLQNASNVLTRQELKDLNSVFQDGYSKLECPLLNKSSEIPTPIESLESKMKNMSTSDCDDGTGGEYNPQRLLPEPVLPCEKYQKSLLLNLHQEFWDLPTNFQEKPMVFGSHPKNRYKTILPNEHSRVILRAEAGESDEGYINANYIKGHENAKNCYIATQGPLQNTVYDFWLMVYQNGCQFHRDGCTKTNEERHFGSPQAKTHPSQDPKSRNADNQKASVQKIVMLTNLMENGRQKCEKYFPTDLNEEMVFKRLPNSSYSSACSGGTFFSEDIPVDCNSASSVANEDVNTFKIKNVGIINKTGYTIRKLYVKYKNKFLNTKTEGCKVFKLGDCVGSDNKDAFRISVTAPDNTLKEDDSKENSLIVYHYWFDNWADHKCPKDVTALLELSLDVLQSRLIEFDAQAAKRLRGEIDNVSTCSSNENITRERRLSAFQTAKAFFDEVSRSNSQEDHFKLNSSRKNSLAGNLDAVKPKYNMARRESTGGINPKSGSARPIAEVKQGDLKNKKCKSTSSAKINPNIEVPPVIIHCSAGIGRTGCLIAVLNGIKQLKIEDKVDILGIVCNMRLNRGGMVQNSEQYELIHKVLCLYEDTGLPDIQ